MHRHFASFILAILALLPLASRAQNAVGSWEVMSNYGIDRADIIDTKDRVYFCAGGSLFHYDKTTDETYSYNLSNGLSDVNVTAIYRNYDRNCTVVIYDNSNIDVVGDDNTIVNLSDIKDAASVSDKTIYQVAFDGDDMYVATAFGLVRYDLKRNAVKESGMYGIPVRGVTAMGGHVVIGTDTALYALSTSQRINDFSRFRKLYSTRCSLLDSPSADMVVVSEGVDNWTRMYRVDFDNYTAAHQQSWLYMGANVRFKRFGEYHAMTVNNTVRLYKADDEGRIVSHELSLSPKLSDVNVFVAGNGSGAGNDLWYVNEWGLGHLTFSTPYAQVNNAEKDTNFTIDRQPSYPMGTSIHGGPMRLAATDRGIYATYNAQSRFPSHDGYRTLMSINLINNGFTTNLTPLKGEYTLTNSVSDNRLYAPHHVVVDPTDPSTLYLPTWFEGIWKVKDGKVVAKYDHTNSPIDKSWPCSVEDVSFDANGNLWIISQNFTTEIEDVAVLPAAKNKANSCTADDWIVLNFPDFGTCGSRDSKIVHLKHSKNKNLAIITQTFGDKNVIVYDTKGTSALSDDQFVMFNQFTDQDGKSFGPYSVLSIAEDRDGNVWLGTECGIIVAHNLRKMVTEKKYEVERVKVPRNDGSSLADYLLDNQVVRAIAVDAGNKKWIATNTSGAYYVSADGREIFNNFTRDNSLIPSDAVEDIACDTRNSDVYFATGNGLAIYHSTVAPSAKDFSEVYAYPNPVRPDYNGWITIKGLMDNSLVKIADTAGNVFLQTRSEGGMVIWDGCNAAGERVATGVYYVFASQNEGEASNGAVAKILVVK